MRAKIEEKYKQDKENAVAAAKAALKSVGLTKADVIRIRLRVEGL